MIACANASVVLAKAYERTLVDIQGKPDALSLSNIDPELFISKISTRYSLVLNKHPSVDDHLLLLTDVFEPQSDGLTGEDLAVWHSLVLTLDAVGFYNSDVAAGASQTHKHMQVGR